MITTELKLRLIDCYVLLS